jgi:hypothetical protein
VVRESKIFRLVKCRKIFESCLQRKFDYKLSFVSNLISSEAEFVFLSAYESASKIFNFYVSRRRQRKIL